jgi:esterase/lipase superfamily enzyme
MRVSRIVAWVAVAMLVAGCGGRPRGVLEPVTTIAPGTSSVTMVVATTRSGEGVSRAELFSGERGRLAFADMTVSIPPEAARKVGEVQWPTQLPGDPSRDFVTVRADLITRDQAIAAVNTMAARSKPRRVMVFVHGFNNRFEDAVYRFAQIVHDSRVDAAPLLFTWPSRGQVFAYGYDRESSNFSRDALEAVLAGLVRDTSVDEITILAHSMGNWVTLEALRQMAIRDGRIPAKINDVMLAAPDVDIDVFRTQIEAIGEPRPDFTVFVSRDDRALAVSRRVWGSTARLGEIDPRAEPYRSELEGQNIVVVDLTEVRTADGLNHGKFAESPEVVRLIGARLAGQQLTDTQVGLGDTIGNITTGAATAVGTAAGLVLTAPIAIFDGRTRENYGNRVNDLGHAVAGTAGATGDLVTAPVGGLNSSGGRAAAPAAAAARPDETGDGK